MTKLYEGHLLKASRRFCGVRAVAFWDEFIGDSSTRARWRRFLAAIPAARASSIWFAGTGGIKWLSPHAMGFRRPELRTRCTIADEMHHRVGHRLGVIR
jgi:hypothetical protein